MAEPKPLFHFHLEVLILEDDSDDAYLIERQVRKVAPEASVFVCYTFALFKAIFEEGSTTKHPYPDLILSDYRLGGMVSGHDALRLIQDLPESIPFYFITSTMDNEVLAAQTTLASASGFFLKKNLSYLHQDLMPILAEIEVSKGLSSTSENADASG